MSFKAYIVDSTMRRMELDVVHASEYDALAAEVAALRSRLLDAKEQVAALESREVCTVAHENVETCGYCQRDALTAENTALRKERDAYRDSATARDRNEDALRVALKAANSQAERFEREWYLRGDELDSVRERLAEADALLQLIAGHRQAVAFFAPQLAGVIAALDRIDAHLARKP